MANFLTALRNQAASGEDIFTLPMGKREVYVVASPVLAEAILITHKDNFVKLGGDGKASGLSAVLGEGLLTNSNRSSWFQQRRMIQPLLYKQSLSGWTALIAEQTKVMLASWQPKAEVVLDEALLETTLNIIYPLMFGVTAEEARATHNQLIRLPLHLATAKKRDVRTLRERLDPIILDLIQTRRQVVASTSDVNASNTAKLNIGLPTPLLDALIQAKDASTGETMNDIQLRDEVATLISAGHETTAYALTWACALVAHYPQVQERLQAELDGFFEAGGDALDLLKLPYLNAVWQETLRLYPTIPTAPRVCLQDTTLTTSTGDMTISQGARVLVSIYLIQRHLTYWQDADIFRPERFLDVDATKADAIKADESRKHKLAYMPFGAGERFCVGRELARLEGLIMLAHCVYHMNFDDLPTLPVANVAISLLPKEPIKVRVYARTAQISSEM
ncbi:MAG: cytochrome P450 [Deinococcota bacterium]